MSITAVWLYVLHARAEQRRLVVLVAASLLAALSMLAKPTAVVVPILMLWIDVTALARPWRRAITATLPIFAIAVVLSVVARTIQPAIEVERETLVGSSPQPCC